MARQPHSPRKSRRCGSVRCPFPPPSSLAYTSEARAIVVADELVKHYTYDGLGRLIRTQSPFSSPDNNLGVRTERFYYDGIRRIQELVADPIQSLEMASISSNSVVAAAANASQSSQSAAAAGELDETATPLTVEQTQLNGGPIGIPIAMARLEREYIWGPGDGGGGAAGVDELLVQYDVNRKPWWVLQDAGGDIVALCDNSGSITGAPFVAAQWTYDAYGAVFSADHLAPHPFMHAGHKGLFFDRLDVGVAETAVPGSDGGIVGLGAAGETPRLVPFAHAIYHNRNRAYNPQFGRFMQADPNASGLALLEGASYNGRGMEAIALSFNIFHRYGDGPNLYQYLGSNTWNRSDPMGLSWDPFDMVDEFVMESAMERAAFMERIGKGSAAAAYVGLIIVSMLPFPVSAIAADLGASALEGNVPPELVMAKKVLGFASLAGISRSILMGSAHGARVAGAYIMKHGVLGSLRNGQAALSGLSARGMNWVMRKTGVIKACGCFTAATLVWTSSGLVPIEQVEVGESVLAYNEVTGESEYRVVTNTIVSPSAALLDLTLIHSKGHTETIQTTDEHPFMVVVGEEGDDPVRGVWKRADQLQPGDSVSTLSGAATVSVVRLTHEQQVVYNFAVEGLENYRVGPDGVLVHNCGAGNHHLFPMYMKGLKSGTTRYADKDMHNDIHNFINAAGRKYGIPTKQAGTKAFNRWYSKHTGDPNKELVDALTEAYTRFDAKYGTMWTSDLHQQLRKQGFMP